MLQCFFLYLQHYFFFFSSISVFSFLNVFLNVLFTAAVFSLSNTVFVILHLEVFLIHIMI